MAKTKQTKKQTKSAKSSQAKHGPAKSKSTKRGAPGDEQPVELQPSTSNNAGNKDHEAASNPAKPAQKVNNYWTWKSLESFMEGSSKKQLDSFHRKFIDATENYFDERAQNECEDNDDSDDSDY